ncbi:hypothetical protein BJ508DRAFT_414854 [Ascobolus immersus RN42]|uniref:C2H2-type domain-containing protein n=1 Tax=Ascobolus immersus RN42 TaxID=1160509 RepID=A0A3N4I514_ASCIM|nr:hypothetical protein BJ508DRAFT_414854 [Ascobolus immersus RN42]
MALSMLEPVLPAPALSMMDHDSRHYRPRTIGLQSMSFSTYPPHGHGSFTESLSDTSLPHSSKHSHLPLDPALFTTPSSREMNSSTSTGYNARDSVDSGYGGNSWPTSSIDSQRSEDMSAPPKLSPITAWGSSNNDFAGMRQRGPIEYSHSHYDEGHSDDASETTTNTGIYTAQTAPTYQHSYGPGSLAGDSAPIFSPYQASEDQWSSRKPGGTSGALAGIGSGVNYSSAGGVSPNALWNPTTAEERETYNDRISHPNRQSGYPYSGHTRTHSHSSIHSLPPTTYELPKLEPASSLTACLDKQPRPRRRRGPQPSRETHTCPLPTCRERNRTFKSKAEYRRHLLKHHRPFICPFHFAGCPSVFSAKNEWHRHLISIHAYHETYQCKEPKCAFTHGTFNRKDLFKAHLLRTHKLEEEQIEAALARGRSPPFRKSPITGAQVAVREEEMWPQQLECGFQGCKMEFRHMEGESRKAVWDKWIEHRSKHCLNVDTMKIAGEKGSWVEGEGLKRWAFDSGFVVFEGGRYRVNMR